MGRLFIYMFLLWNADAFHYNRKQLNDLPCLLYSKDLEEEIRKKTDQVAHAQNSATKFLQEELEAKSQVSRYHKKLKI